MKVKPPLLRPPGQRLDQPLKLKEKLVCEVAKMQSSYNGGGGVRVHPPKLVGAVDTNDAGWRLRELESVAAAPPTKASVQEVAEVQEIALEGQSAPLEKGDEGGGGVRLPPPKLKPFESTGGLDAPFAGETALPATRTHLSHVEDLVPIEEVPVEMGPETGGGVRLPPPKLLPVSETVGGILEEATELEEVESAPVVDGVDAGGGVRVVPHRLKPVGEQASAAEALESAEEALIAIVEDEDNLDGDELAPLDEVPFDTSGGGGGVRLAPPKLQPIVPEPQETELLASAEPECLDVSEVAREGGGVRLPPPKLMPVGELAEYAQFKHDAQADPRTRRGRHFVDGDTHGTAEEALDELVADDIWDESTEGIMVSKEPISGIDLFMMLVTPTPERPAADESLGDLEVVEAAQLETGAEAGGGVRLPPPPLKPINASGTTLNFSADLADVRARRRRLFKPQDSEQRALDNNHSEAMSVIDLEETPQALSTPQRAVVPVAPPVAGQGVA